MSDIIKFSGISVSLSNWSCEVHLFECVRPSGIACEAIGTGAGNASMKREVLQDSRIFTIQLFCRRGYFGGLLGATRYEGIRGVIALHQLCLRGKWSYIQTCFLIKSLCPLSRGQAPKKKVSTAAQPKRLNGRLMKSGSLQNERWCRGG